MGVCFLDLWYPDVATCISLTFIRSEIQKKELDLARVKDANYDMTEERVQLTTKLTETERKSRERKEEIQKLKMQYVRKIANGIAHYNIFGDHLVIMI